MEKYITVYGLITTKQRLYLSRDFWLPIYKHSNNHLGWFIIERERANSFKIVRGMGIKWVSGLSLPQEIDNLPDIPESKFKWMYSQEQNK